MKAKEYADRYTADPSAECLVKICHDFIIEGKEIVIARGLQNDYAMFAVLNEQDLKWRAFAKQFDDVNPDGFDNMIRHRMPEVWHGWKRSKAASEKTKHIQESIGIRKP